MMTEGPGKSYTTMWKYLSARFSRYIDDKTGDINHQDVISDLAGKRTELSGSYISSIILANLIALLGLLTNSVAVVIGAMLISPLMGPIFSLGLAFALGDLALSRRAVRNILCSVVLTVCIAALFTLFSPLKGATHEILARTRPNIYDLLIAVFAGTAGALALCTRKNYLFTTTGVAVATAVIPPLSVVGYGVGTWQPAMAAGGFLLFFTNLVAIVISSNVVFYILRFRGSMAEEPRYTARRRFQILGTVLVFISIPLIFTLVTDIRKIKLTGMVESMLKAHLNRHQYTRLTRVSTIKEDGSYIVAASINTVKYVDSEIQKKIEKELAALVSKPVSLELEQVIVRSGNIESSKIPLRTATPVASPPPENLATLREKTMARLRDGCREIETFLAPFKVAGCWITFSDLDRPITVHITIARDFPVSTQEERWLQVVLQKKLAVDVDLKVETTPFLPPVGFTESDEVDEISRKSLEALKRVMLMESGMLATIEIPRDARRHRTFNSRLSNLHDYLVKIQGVPANRIKTVSGSGDMIRVKLTEK